MIAIFNPHAMDEESFEARLVWAAAHDETGERYPITEVTPGRLQFIKVSKPEIGHYRQEVMKFSENGTSQQLLDLVADLAVCNELLIISSMMFTIVATDTSGTDYHRLYVGLEDLSTSYQKFVAKSEDFNGFMDKLLGRSIQPPQD